MSGRDRPGLLVATRLSVLAAELAEPDRFRRGRVYAREGAVVDVAVRDGVVHAVVLGSRRDPYHVELRARPGRAGQTAPSAADVDVRCTCPDASVVCKHAVAALLVFADRVAEAPDLLGQWWTATPGSAGSPGAESPMGSPGAEAPVGRWSRPAPSPELQAFFGGPGRRAVDPTGLAPLGPVDPAVGAGELEHLVFDALGQALAALRAVYG